MKTLSTVRFGLIGAGMIAGYAVDSITRHAHGKVVAAQDLNAERLAALKSKYNIPATYATAKELFSDPNVDAVYIATPNKFHCPLAIEALEAGKHVILEKPFAMNAKEAAEAIATAKKAGRTLTLGMNQRFTGDSQKIKTLADQGAFGEIYHAKAYWMRRTGIPKLGTWFGNMELAGGGSLYDIGVHMLDLCLYTINNFEPVSVTGATYTKFGHRGLGEGGWGLSDRTNIKFDVDDFASAFIKFKNGASVTLDTTWACHTALGNKDNVEIFGTEGGASLRPAKVYRYGKTPESGYEVIDEVKADLSFPHQDRFHNFINFLRGEEKLCTDIEQGLVVQRILDGIAESARTGKEVRLA